VATVCEWFGLKTTQTVSNGLASKPAAMVSGGLASKPAVTIFVGLASKPVATVFSSVASKLVATVSLGLASKPAIGFLVEPQNQGGGGFPGLGIKTDRFGFVIWAQNLCDSFLVWASKPSRLRFVGCATKLTEGGRRGTRVEI
jgi:hypothetical protein